MSSPRGCLSRSTQSDVNGNVSSFLPTSTRVLMSYASFSQTKEDEELRAITLTPAETLGVQDRVGSLDAGKDADFVVWSGHPFRVRSKVEQVHIDGKRVDL